jgi:uncharacterized protein HemX|nr:MAG TPA_asm: hypothetical protein [Caudoviricetes sp.]
MAVSAAAAMWAAGAMAAAGAAASVYSGNKQAKAQEAASKRAEQQAKEQAAQQRQQQRKQEGQSADVGSILDQNTNAGLSGGSTLLTGAGGVGDLNLGAGGKLG